MSDTDFGASSPFANVGEFGAINYAEMNKGVTPVFFVEPLEDGNATEKAGALRMYEQEMVRIHVAGDQFTVACQPVDAAIKERFAVQYGAWKTKKIERHVDGTPLKNWPLLSPLRVAEFESMNIFSVEHLAAVSDSNVNRMADGRIWREKAIAWLASAKDGAVAAKYAAENERLREDSAEKDKRIDDLAARLAALEEKRPVGRPRTRDAA